MQYNGQTYQAWGLGMHPLYSYRLRTGRWFTAADTAGGARTAPPVVLGPMNFEAIYVQRKQQEAAQAAAPAQSH